MSIFQRKAKLAQDSKMAMIQATAIASLEIRPLIDLLSKDIWNKNYKMAEARCKQNADNLDKYPEIQNLLCKILPGYAIFVEIQKRGKSCV